MEGERPASRISLRIPVGRITLAVHHGELVAEYQLTGPYLLKFDTHGYEMPILRAAAKVLRETQVIVMEVYNFDITPHCLCFPAMCAHLETLGFRCLDLVDPMLRSRDQALWQMDLVFGRADDPRFAQTEFE